MKFNVKSNVDSYKGYDNTNKFKMRTISVVNELYEEKSFNIAGQEVFTIANYIENDSVSLKLKTVKKDDTNLVKKSTNTIVNEPIINEINTIVDYFNTSVELYEYLGYIDLDHNNQSSIAYVKGEVTISLGGNDTVVLEAPTIVNDDGSVQFGSVIIEAEINKYHDCLVQFPESLVNVLQFQEVIDMPQPLLFDEETYKLHGYVNFTEIKNIKFKFANEVIISCTIRPVMKLNARNKRKR